MERVSSFLIEACTPYIYILPSCRRACLYSLFEAVQSSEQFGYPCEVSQAQQSVQFDTDKPTNSTHTGAKRESSPSCILPFTNADCVPLQRSNAHTLVVAGCST